MQNLILHTMVHGMRQVLPADGHHTTHRLVFILPGNRQQLMDMAPAIPNSLNHIMQQDNLFMLLCTMDSGGKGHAEKSTL